MDIIQDKTRHSKKMLLISLMSFSVATIFGQVNAMKNPTDFLPKGYVCMEKIYGDLNKDGNEDCVLLIKGTDKKQIITDKYRGRLDLNRRGLIVLFKKSDHYELVLKNYACFSSENEDGGVYVAPELLVGIKNGNLFTHYGHGRYGYWKFYFRFQTSDFELIGYDSAYDNELVPEGGVFNEESINFLSKKKFLKEVIRVNPNGKATYKESWKKISISRLIKLSEIKDFDDLDMTIY